MKPLAVNRGTFWLSRNSDRNAVDEILFDWKTSKSAAFVQAAAMSRRETLGFWGWRRTIGDEARFQRWRHYKRISLVAAGMTVATVRRMAATLPGKSRLFTRCFGRNFVVCWLPNYGIGVRATVRTGTTGVVMITMHCFIIIYVVIRVAGDLRLSFGSTVVAWFAGTTAPIAQRRDNFIRFVLRRFLCSFCNILFSFLGAVCEEM